MTPDLSTWMTKQQVAAALGVSEKTVSRMAADGKLIQETYATKGATPRPVYEPESVYKHHPGKTGDTITFSRPPILLSPPAVPDAPPKAKPLPLSELRWKTFLTTDEAVRYSGLPEAVLVELATRGKISRWTNMKPYRYSRKDLESADIEEGEDEYPELIEAIRNRHGVSLLDTQEKVDRWNVDNPGEHRKIGDQVMVRRPVVFEPYPEVAAK